MADQTFVSHVDKNDLYGLWLNSDEGQRTYDYEEKPNMANTFEVTDSKIHVTDPCYERGTWCAGFDLPALNGTWEANANVVNEGEWGNRVEYLEAWHEDFQWSKPELQPTYDIGVDSGQCGIFNNLFPEGNSTGDYDDKESFYGRACMVTLGTGDAEGTCGNWGVMPEGVVSSSGYGDGSYNLYGCKNDNGEFVYLKVVFMGDEDDEYEEEYDDEDEEEEDED